jgi:hypothetical protein
LAKRPTHQRPKKDFRRGTLAAQLPAAAAIAARVRYVASGEHKNYPSPTGLWTMGHKIDKAKCDRFDTAEWPRLEETLRAAINAGCVDVEMRGDFPARVWAFINGTLHEARLTNQTRGEYHGFPIEYPEHFPADPENQLRNAPRVTIPVH